MAEISGKEQAIFWIDLMREPEISVIKASRAVLVCVIGDLLQQPV